MFKSSKNLINEQQETILKLTEDNDILLCNIKELENENNSIRKELNELKKSYTILYNKKEKLENILDKSSDKINNLKNKNKELEKQYKTLQDFLMNEFDFLMNEYIKKNNSDKEKLYIIKTNIENLLIKMNSLNENIITAKKISDELGLLGINATIQAAHIGEQGKSVLIVADYIDKVSESLNRNINDIELTLGLYRDEIQNILQKIKTLSISINDNLKNFQQITEQVNNKLITK
ncbi:hypothetical protein [Hydrogenimonas thermophila]|uniref:Methyl-accepting chemotaxis protein (MCP) signalling domain-containing protein n=1 Tax=Hydrogenimonas thermophila TaxID=223786 RepID=A0A1I5UQF7_9BACT|nr:hypothetical protein [Hydrogenimonas thermophila]SFP97440.1 hypothetical protein SAMN05216234_1685 [Hydrogenimonas thermophila]